MYQNDREKVIEELTDCLIGDRQFDFIFIEICEKYDISALELNEMLEKKLDKVKKEHFKI